MNGRDRSGHRVEPGGEHDHVHVEGAPVGLDAGRRDRPDRLLPQIDQGDVGPVVGGVIVGLEARAFGPERMVMGSERVRRFGILHDRADPLADQLSRQRVALEVAALVGPQLRQHDDEIAGGQRLLETLATLGLAELPAELCRPRQRHTGQRPARLFTVVVDGRFPARRRGPPAAGHCAPGKRSSACVGKPSDGPPARRSSGSPGCPTIPCR